jgi:GNAT superfamily N-acetyltransferase
LIKLPVNTSQRIRPAVKSDLACLQAIERAAGTLFPEGRIPDVDDVMPLSDLETAAYEGLLLVAISDESVVGFAMAHELDGSLHLAVMAVHPGYGNRGLGRKLVNAILHEAARRQLAKVTLTTFGDLPWNGPFYQKAGFRVLSDAELSPSLRDIIAHEERLGMVNRIAMAS